MTHEVVCVIVLLSELHNAAATWALGSCAGARLPLLVERSGETQKQTTQARGLQT